MTHRGKLFVAIASTAIAFYFFLGLTIEWFGTKAQQPINDPGAQLRIFESVLQHIQNDYVDEPDLEKVRTGALRGLAHGLDAYSSYLTVKQVKAFRENAFAEKFGIGAEFSQLSSYLYVIAVSKSSPAEKAGLKAGDIIEYVDERATRDISLYDAKRLVLGDLGTTVKLRVLRAGGKPKTISVTREKFKIPKTVAVVKNGDIGVIKVNSLARGRGEEIIGQIRSLKDKGIRKIVLDLRNLASGKKEEAVLVSNAFIKSGELAKLIGRENKVIKTYAADPSKHIFDGEIVAIIDFGTAGAAEIIASSLLDRKRGEVVGERSYGAGTEQKLFTLRGGDGFLLTTSKLASAKGVAFLANKQSESGIQPSVEVKRPDAPDQTEVEGLFNQNQYREGQNKQPTPKEKTDAEKLKKREDVQMKRAIELLQEKAKTAGS